MPTWISPAQRRTILAVVLASLLFLVYFLTLTGVTHTGDEQWIMDVTESLATRGDMQLNQTLYLGRQTSANVEPLQPALSVPLYWLALNIPWIGNVHTVMLFNALVTCLTAVLLFYYALTLGYDSRPALAVALLYGLTSMAWPYSQYYFREPLMGLTLLAAAFCWEHWRRVIEAKGPRVWTWFAAAIVTTVLALISKESALIMLPVLAMVAIPSLSILRQQGRRLLVVGVVILATAAVLIGGLLLFRQGGFLMGRYDLGQKLSVFVSGLANAGPGLLGYFVTPGRSIWIFSPITILALASPALLPRSRWRESWLVLAGVFWFGLVYAAIKGAIWFGGANWGPRFMLPIVPLLMLATLPAIDRMVNSKALWPKLALGVLALAGFAVQIGGVGINLHSYLTYYEQNTGELPWVGPALWNPRWSQAIGTLLYLPQGQTDIIWLTQQVDWVTIIVIAVGLVGAAALMFRLANQSIEIHRTTTTLGTLYPLIALFIALFGLSRAYDDPRYLSDNAALWPLKSFLEANAAEDDVIMLSTHQYVPFFLNYYKGKAIWYSLPNSPGERFSPEQPPIVESDNLEELVAPTALALFKDFSPGGSRYQDGRLVWLVVDTGPFISWSTRPPERYLATNYYTISQNEFDPRVRVVSFLLNPAPDVGVPPQRPTDVIYGDIIRLVGYDVWASTGEPERLRPGEYLGISLVWEAIKPVDMDYTIAIHWLDSAGQVVAQQDRQPVGGFLTTSQWKVRLRLRDNYGFVVPDLPPGRYTTRVTLYQWPSLERLLVRGASSTDLGDSAGLFTLEIR